MKGQPKTPKIPTTVRAIVADNVMRRMDAMFLGAADKPMALSLATGKPPISKSTIQRIMAGANGPTIDTLYRVAEALDLSFYHLFIPGLDVRSPLIVPGADANELRIIKEWQRKQGLTQRPARRPTAEDHPRAGKA